MAKKKKTATKKTTKKTGKQGKKQCPKCSKLVGVRTHQCKCGHKFQMAKKKTQTKKKTATTKSNTLDTVQTALALIEKTGSTAKAKQLIEALEKIG